MPAMSRIQSTFCRSAPWRLVARRIVLPWALPGSTLEGQVLEIGAGSGAMAEQVLESFASTTITATDYDDAMVDAITARLARFGGRAVARQADATALPFDAESFDTVLSWVMLHHTVDWEKALAEAVRVARPGGRVVGYDLLSSRPLRVLHRDDHDIRLMSVSALREQAASLPLETADIRPTAAGNLVRFTRRKRR